MKRVFITGGTGTLGHALVPAFSKAGYSVTLQYRSQETEAGRLCAQFGATAVQMDFSRDTVLADPTFDVLINNAGISVEILPLHLTHRLQWQQTLAVNVSAAYELAKSCLPTMIERHWGRIVNISSIYGLRAEESYGLYSVSKHALRGLTRTLARDYGRHGLTCNEICPGPMESTMMRKNRALWAEQHGESLEQYMKELLSEIPTGRFAGPEGIAELAVFLCSDAAQDINGVSIPVDGGFLS